MTVGLTGDEFAQSYLHRRAAEHAVLIISEAVRALPVELTERHPGPPWAEIRGIGNVLRHDYFAVEPAVLWSILTLHLPLVERVVDAMIEEVQPASSETQPAARARRSHNSR